MRLLLDTHAFLWFVFDDPKLSPKAVAVIQDYDNELLLSTASVWEVAIKVSTGKLSLRTDTVPFFVEACRTNRITLLSIEVRHLDPLQRLPFHHRDPFDRLLIAQSIVEQVPILSADAVLDAYAGIDRIW